MPTANTITNISYTGTTQTGNVTATYGIPVTAHIWGAGGGSTALYPGAGGGYSRVDFIANPGDVLTVAVGQGGGLGGVTAPPPVPPKTWTTRSPGYTGTTLYPGYPYGQGQFEFLSTYGVWSVQYGGPQTYVSDTWSVLFPVSGYYLMQGQSLGTGINPFSNPNGNPGTLAIDGTTVLTATQGGFFVTAKVYVTAGTHTVSVYADSAYSRGNVFQSVAFTIELANPTRIPNTPAGIPGASYIALLFNTRFPPPGQDDPVYAYGNGDSFLDQWGVWNGDQNDPVFVREYTILVPATTNIIFQMVASYYGRVFLDGTQVVAGSGGSNNTINQAIINVAAGTRTLRIEGDGLSAGSTNRIGVTLGTGDTTSYSGGRGGISDPTSKQGFGGGGGGATVLSLNSRVIGVGAGGGGGAGAASTNINYITTRYIATVGNPYNWPAGVPAGTNGYITDLLAVDYADVRRYEGIFWTIVINGTVVYAANREPPVTLAKPVGVGVIYPFENNPSSTYAKSVDSFDYFSLNTSAITSAMFNGQNGQDVFNFNTTDTGGGGGGGGGARGGNGGAGRGSGGGGFSGHNGLSLGGTAVADPIGRLPFSNDYYPGGGVAEGAAAGTASNGGNGYVVLEFQTGGGILVKDGDEWKAVQTVYVKDDGTWKEVQTSYIYQVGTWKPTQGGTVPTFSSVVGFFGAWTRPYSAGGLSPLPPAPNYVAVSQLIDGPI